ncbi:MAG: alkaline phosphatase family protein [Thermoflexales bacterium]|nr:alkaline phosphatase family protein [Thermoflexales bacterium]MDW8351604.1 alkaline phosphatase family protein [Anaerolineae bacterium]
MRKPSIERRSLFRDFRRLAISFGWFFVAELIILAMLTLAAPGMAWASPSLGLILRGLVVALVIAGANFALLPALLWLRAPLIVLTVVVATLVVNALLLMVAVELVLDAHVALSPAELLPSALFLSLANAIANGLIALDDDYTYLQFVIQTVRGTSAHFDRPKDPSRRGMVLLEIDGLSYERIQSAVERGLMPATRDLLKAGHCLMQFDCGLPSQTSASQAGIMYGDNEDIPAFRWYDKRRRRLRVSNNPDDAHFINLRHSNGRGLLRHGASINNLINGDAARSLLTLSTIPRNSKLQTERALDVLAAFWFNPYTFGRTLALCVVDLCIEIYQALRQRARNVRPRLDRRFPSPYTGLRVITNVLLRDLAVYATMQEIIRGAPVIYMSFLGYDEVAHHAGPDSPDAMNTLKGFDRQIRHIQQTIRYLAPFDYDLVILSDHGQSWGATFRQRYGKTLRKLIDDLTRAEVHVGEERASEAGHSFVQALIAELNATSQQLKSQEGRRIRRAAMRATARTLEGIEKRRQPSGIQGGDDIIVCASGNLAHIYFNSVGMHRVSLQAIEAEHPGLVDALIRHEGIGFVVVANDEGHVLALGKRGARDLSTGAVTGEDPLEPFADGDVHRRAEQLLRLAQFESSGDLILNSALYPDGSVAAFEELIGSHGGLGGQQTHAFILHPCVGRTDGNPINNSADVYVLLEAWKHRAE